MNDDRRRAEFTHATDKQHRACHGKIRWPSRKNARAVARAAEKSYADGPWNCYRCPLCRRWHIGHDRHARSA